MRSASGKETFSYSITNVKTLPPFWQPKHLYVWRDGVTWKEGVFSLWNGHSP